MRYFVVFVLLAAVIAARPTAALACKCEHPALRTAVQGADAVFIGRVVDVQRAGDVDQITVAVTDVWTGTVAATQVVHSVATSCGLVTGGAKQGRSFLFVARLDAGVLRARQCDGSRRATAGVRASLTKLLGAPTAP